MLDNAHYLPGTIAALAWFAVLVRQSYVSNQRIISLKHKYDPDGLFIRKNPYVAMGPSINLFRVDLTHSLCTQAFLDEWRPAYGGYWLIVTGVLTLPGKVRRARTICAAGGKKNFAKS